MKIAFRLNGDDVSVEIEPRHTLAEMLTRKLRLTGTKVSCEAGTAQSAIPKCELVETEGDSGTAGTHVILKDGKQIASFLQDWNSHSAWEFRHNEALQFCRDLESRGKCTCNF